MPDPMVLLTLFLPELGEEKEVAEVNIQLTASTAGRLFFNLSTHQDVTGGQNFAVSWNMTNCNAFGY